MLMLMLMLILMLMCEISLFCCYERDIWFGSIGIAFVDLVITTER
jgi:hypothetical protein